MTARLSLYRKAEQELYKLDRSVKAQFYDFCHIFRKNPDQPGLDKKKLKGDSRIHRAKINQSYRALLTPTGVDADGTEHWLVIAVRHRRDVYEELQVAVNRVTGEIEFVDLAVVGDSALRRAGITLTPAEPDGTAPAVTPEPAPIAPEPEPTPPLLAAYDAGQLRELGVADQLIDLALAVTDSVELDQLLEGAPLLSKDILYGLAAGLDIEDVRKEITAPVELPHEPDPDDLAAALIRTKVTAVDEHVQAAIDEGDFRAWKVYLHPTQERIVHRDYSGPARVSGGPGTGKTIVALHRVKHLAERLPPDTTNRSCSPPSPRTSPPTCGCACPPSSPPNCWHASRSSTSTSWPPASWEKPPPPAPPSSAPTTTSPSARCGSYSPNSTTAAGSRSSCWRSGNR